MVQWWVAKFQRPINDPLLTELTEPELLTMYLTDQYDQLDTLSAAYKRAENGAERTKIYEAARDIAQKLRISVPDLCVKLDRPYDALAEELDELERTNQMTPERMAALIDGHASLSTVQPAGDHDEARILADAMIARSKRFAR